MILDSKLINLFTRQTPKQKYFLYGIWGPGRYLDGSGSKKRAKLRSRIQICMDMCQKTALDNFGSILSKYVKLKLDF